MWGGGGLQSKTCSSCSRYYFLESLFTTCLCILSDCFFNRVWKQIAMALKPLLKSKVDELFARWLSDPETQLNLKENLRQLCHGESITLQHLTSPKSSSKQSPRLRPSSPPYSPNSTKLPNPRSPRRALSNKNKANNGSPRVTLLYIMLSLHHIWIVYVYIISELIHFGVFKDFFYLVSVTYNIFKPMKIVVKVS